MMDSIVIGLFTVFFLKAFFYVFTDIQRADPSALPGNQEVVEIFIRWAHQCVGMGMKHLHGYRLLTCLRGTLHSWVGFVSHCTPQNKRFELDETPSHDPPLSMLATLAISMPEGPAVPWAPASFRQKHLQLLLFFCRVPSQSIKTCSYRWSHIIRTCLGFKIHFI